MINVDEIIANGTYQDNNGVIWERRYSQDRKGYEYWVEIGNDGIWHSAMTFRDYVVLDQTKRDSEATVLEKAGRSGAFGTRAQSTLMVMAEMVRKDTLKDFLDENGCRW